MAKISNVQLPNGNNYDIRATAIPYGEVDSTSTATVYTATVPGITELTDGVCVLLRNGVVTSASGFTININGLGAKPSYSNMATGNDITPTDPTRDTTIFNINYTMLFVYSSTVVSGGCWICYRGYDANTNTIGYQLRTNSTRLKMSSIVYRYRLLFTSPDGTKYVPANNSSSTNATAARAVNQEKIDPWGRIVYYGTTSSVAAGSMPAAAYLWDRYNITLGYSFNRTGAALALTNHAPVYIKCAPQTDGSAIIDADTPYVQALPSTEDGKIYIHLGIASDTTTVELYDVHPVYYYKDGAIRIWTNAGVSSSGAVTSVGIQNGGGLTVSGSPVTTSGTITVGHTNSVTAQNTQGVYPVTIDANGHIASYGAKEDVFKVIEIDTSSYTKDDLINQSTIGVAITSAETTAINSVYDTLKTAIKFNFGSNVVMAYGTGERFGFVYQQGVEFTNIMKFTFAGDYSNSIVNIMYSPPIYAGCAYIFPECTVPSLANRMIVVYKDLTTVLTDNDIGATSPIGIAYQTGGNLINISFDSDYISRIDLYNGGVYDSEIVPDSNHHVTIAATGVTVSRDDSDSSKIHIQGGTMTDVQINGTSVANSGVANILTNTAYDSSTNKIATISDTKNITGNMQLSGGNLTLYNSTNGDSPSLIFQRGSLTDNYNDWKIYDTGGNLRIQQRGLNSTDWTNIATFSTNGTLTTNYFSGNGASITNISTSHITDFNSAVDARVAAYIATLDASNTSY